MTADYTQQIRNFCITENTVVEAPARDGSWLGVVIFFGSDRNERGDYSLRNQLQTLLKQKIVLQLYITVPVILIVFKCTSTHAFSNLPHNTG